MTMIIDGSGTISGLIPGGLPAATVIPATLATAATPLGVAQTWQSVSRVSGTTYTNNTGRPIMAQYAFTGGGSLTGTFVIAGFTMPTFGSGSSTSGLQFVATAVIPDGAAYSFTTNGSFVSAQELR